MKCWFRLAQIQQRKRRAGVSVGADRSLRGSFLLAVVLFEPGPWPPSEKSKGLRQLEI